MRSSNTRALAEHSGRHLPIHPRTQMDFGFAQADVPRHWIQGEVFQSRFFDALSTMFPVGERYFMVSVRHYREAVEDAQLRQDIQDFLRQESEHTRVHQQYNQRLRDQGIDVDMILRWHDKRVFAQHHQRHSPAYNLACTAAAEHLTALSCHALFDRRGVLDHGDPRVRAMYAWHAVEECEHRAVAFEVMSRVAGVGYVMRCLAMLHTMFNMGVDLAFIMRHMLKADGLSTGQRVRVVAGGLWWLYKPFGGFLGPNLGRILRYFKPGFHPADEGLVPGFEVWERVYAQAGDPIAAGNALHAAGA